MAARSMEICIAGRLGEVRRLVRAVESFANAHGLRPSTRHAVQVALDEIVSNAIRHGAGSNPLRICVRICLEDQCVAVVVEDNGVPFNPLSRPRPQLERELRKRPPGGVGILFVRDLMDQLSYRRKDGRNVLEMRKRLIGSGAEAPEPS